jgi:hypothetical protein
MSRKITMPDYTRVGYVAKGEPKHPSHSTGKIQSAGMSVERSGCKAPEYRADRIDNATPTGQKIHSAGIPVAHCTGGTVCSVPKGKMRNEKQAKGGSQ